MGQKMSVRLRTLKLRRSRQLTQAQLAERAHLSKTTICNLEAGVQTKIEFETIGKLCSALDCTPADLFELVENQENGLVQSQKAALGPFIGSLEYDKPFDHKKLDSDLASIIDSKKRGKRH